jgi:hypothetical protein
MSNQTMKGCNMALEYHEIVDGLKEVAKYSGFAASLLKYQGINGTLSPKQWAAGEAAVLKHRAHGQIANIKVIDVSRIELLLLTAKSARLKNPKFRADGLTFSFAGPNSKNAGAVYVKAGDVYAGKIAGGVYTPSRDAASGTGDTIAKIAADPKGAAISYGRLTGQCSCCGRTLSDPASVDLGIGPVCAEKWGL